MEYGRRGDPRASKGKCACARGLCGAARRRACVQHRHPLVVHLHHPPPAVRARRGGRGDCLARWRATRSGSATGESPRAARSACPRPSTRLCGRGLEGAGPVLAGAGRGRASGKIRRADQPFCCSSRRALSNCGGRARLRQRDAGRGGRRLSMRM